MGKEILETTKLRTLGNPAPNNVGSHSMLIISIPFGFTKIVVCKICRPRACLPVLWHGGVGRRCLQFDDSADYVVSVGIKYQSAAVSSFGRVGR